MCVTASYSSVSPQDSVLEDISSVGRQAGLEVVAGNVVYLSTYWLSFDSGVSCTGVYIILHCCVMTLHMLVVYTCVSTYFHGAMFREKMPGFVQITTFTISSDSESDSSAPVGIIYILLSCRIVE